MRMKSLILTSLLIAISGFASAATLKANSGIEIAVLNGEKVASKTAQLQPGDNQLVLEFGTRLQKGAQREYLSTAPYVVVIRSDGQQEIEVSAISHQYEKIKSLSDNNQPMFVFTSQGKEIQSKQFVLPAPAGAFPYQNVLAVITAYNKKNGLVFESGKIRELKKEVEQASGNKSVTGETENVLQLKLWYSRASNAERSQFNQWILQQAKQS